MWVSTLQHSQTLQLPSTPLSSLKEMTLYFDGACRAKTSGFKCAYGGFVQSYDAFHSTGEIVEDATTSTEAEICGAIACARAAEDFAEHLECLQKINFVSDCETSQ